MGGGIDEFLLNKKYRSSGKFRVSELFAHSRRALRKIWDSKCFFSRAVSFLSINMKDRERQVVKNGIRIASPINSLSPCDLQNVQRSYAGLRRRDVAIAAFFICIAFARCVSCHSLAAYLSVCALFPYSARLVSC